MNIHTSESTNIFDYFSKYLYTYIDIDDGTSILILKFDDDEIETDQTFGNVTSAILSKFLNTTRTGSAHKHAGISFKAFVSGMLVSLLYFLIQFLLFIYLRTKFKELYQANVIKKNSMQESSKPPSSISLLKKKTKIFKEMFGWILVVYKPAIEKYQTKSGIDAYLFLRFLRVLMHFFLLLSLLIMPILIPIHYFSGYKAKELQEIENNGIIISTQSLDIISMSNISGRNSDKLIFHMLLSLFVIVWFHIILLSELKFVHRLSSKEILLKEKQPVLYVDNIPDNLRQNKLKVVNYFNSISPNSVKGVKFVPKESHKIKKIYDKIQHTKHRIEKILLKIILAKFYMNIDADRLVFQDTTWYHWVSNDYKLTLKFWLRKYLFKLKTLNYCFNIKFSINLTTIFLFKEIQIPLLKFRILSFIESCYLELEKTIDEYDSITKKWKEECIKVKTYSNLRYPIGKSEIDSIICFNKAFVTFESITKTHIFGQLLSSFNVNSWNDVIIGPQPDGIIWSNVLVSSTVAKSIRSVLASFISVFIILGWVIPVAFIGLVSQIPYLTSLIPIISRINIQSKILSDVSSTVVPVATLVFITEFVPFIFRWISYLRCCRTQAEIEVNVQLWFFSFLFVHIFLVVTVSSGISFVVEKILNNPVTITTLLAHELPKSSNFFCSFVLIRGLAYSGGNLLQLKELLFEILYYRQILYTPQKKIKRTINSLSFQWGSIYPIFSVLGCIGIIYSVISPIILPFCCISFFLVYFSLKYLLEFQYSGKNNAETYGKLYTQALIQLYAGIYCLEFCMIGLFSLYNSFKLSVFMIVILILTVVAHCQISLRFISKVHQPLLNSREGDHTSELRGRNSGEDSDDFFISFVDSIKEPNICLPRDKIGIADWEQEYMKKKYNLDCDIDKCTVTPSGKLQINQ